MGKIVDAVWKFVFGGGCFYLVGILLLGFFIIVIGSAIAPVEFSVSEMIFYLGFGLIILGGFLSFLLPNKLGIILFAVGVVVLIIGISISSAEASKIIFKGIILFAIVFAIAYLTSDKRKE